ncbi:MAG TPA: hypothetical protein VKR58_15370 [Aquella sp.]|nr:hypothetical protein [Aquella sp.]
MGHLIQNVIFNGYDGKFYQSISVHDFVIFPHIRRVIEYIIETFHQEENNNG